MVYKAQRVSTCMHANATSRARTHLVHGSNDRRRVCRRVKRALKVPDGVRRSNADRVSINHDVISLIVRPRLLRRAGARSRSTQRRDGSGVLGPIRAAQELARWLAVFFFGVALTVLEHECLLLAVLVCAGAVLLRLLALALPGKELLALLHVGVGGYRRSGA